MLFQNTVIESIAYSVPDKALSSSEIEETLSDLYNRLNLPKGRLELMTGIKERRFWSKPTKPSQASTLAGEALLKKTSIDKSSIDILVHSAVCRDQLEPATAAYVHGELGLSPNTQIMDISNACLGCINAIINTAGLIEAGLIKTAMIVAGENGWPLLENTIKTLLESNFTRKEIKPYFANLTIGSGSVAIMLSHKDTVKDNNALKLKHASVLTETSARHLCEGDAISTESLQMQTDSEQLLIAGIRLAKNNWSKFKNLTSWNDDTPELIMTHQVGKQHQNMLYQELGLDPQKDFSIYPSFGNTGSVSLPMCLAKAIETNTIKENQKIALLGIGSGLSSIMVGLES